MVRVGHLTDSSLVARKLLDIEMWACASPTYLARRGMPDGFADLATHDLISWTDRATTWTFRRPDRGSETVEVPPRTVVPEPAALRTVLVGGAER